MLHIKACCNLVLIKVSSNLTHHCLLLVCFQFFNLAYHLTNYYYFLSVWTSVWSESLDSFTSAKSLLTSWRLSISLRIKQDNVGAGQMSARVWWSSTSCHQSKNLNWIIQLFRNESLSWIFLPSQCEHLTNIYQFHLWQRDKYLSLHFTHENVHHLISHMYENVTTICHLISQMTMWQTFITLLGCGQSLSCTSFKPGQLVNFPSHLLSRKNRATNLYHQTSCAELHF